MSNPEPSAIGIFNALSNAIGNISSALGAHHASNRNYRLGMEAVQKYISDPSMENYLLASKHINMNEVLHGMTAQQQLKNMQADERLTEAKISTEGAVKETQDAKTAQVKRQTESIDVEDERVKALTAEINARTDKINLEIEQSKELFPTEKERLQQQVEKTKAETNEILENINNKKKQGLILDANHVEAIQNALNAAADGKLKEKQLEILAHNLEKAKAFEPYELKELIAKIKKIQADTRLVLEQVNTQKADQGVSRAHQGLYDAQSRYQQALTEKVEAETQNIQNQTTPAQAFQNEWGTAYDKFLAGEIDRDQLDKIFVSLREKYPTVAQALDAGNLDLALGQSRKENIDADTQTKLNPVAPEPKKTPLQIYQEGRNKILDTAKQQGWSQDKLNQALKDWDERNASAVLELEQMRANVGQTLAQTGKTTAETDAINNPQTTPDQTKPLTNEEEFQQAWKELHTDFYAKKISQEQFEERKQQLQNMYPGPYLQIQKLQANIGQTQAQTGKTTAETDAINNPPITTDQTKPLTNEEEFQQKWKELHTDFYEKKISQEQFEQEKQQLQNMYPGPYLQIQKLQAEIGRTEAETSVTTPTTTKTFEAAYAEIVQKAKDEGWSDEKLKEELDFLGKKYPKEYENFKQAQIATQQKEKELDLLSLSADELRQKIKRGEIDAQQAVFDLQERIKTAPLDYIAKLLANKKSEAETNAIIADTDLLEDRRKHLQAETDKILQQIQQGKLTYEQGLIELQKAQIELGSYGRKVEADIANVEASTANLGAKTTGVELDNTSKQNEIDDAERKRELFAQGLSHLSRVSGISVPLLNLALDNPKMFDLMFPPQEDQGGAFGHLSDSEQKHYNDTETELYGLLGQAGRGLDLKIFGDNARLAPLISSLKLSDAQIKNLDEQGRKNLGTTVVNQSIRDAANHLVELAVLADPNIAARDRRSIILGIQGDPEFKQHIERQVYDLLQRKNASFSPESIIYQTDQLIQKKLTEKLGPPNQRKANNPGSIGVPTTKDFQNFSASEALNDMQNSTTSTASTTQQETPEKPAVTPQQVMDQATNYEPTEPTIYPQDQTTQSQNTTPETAKDYIDSMKGTSNSTPTTPLTPIQVIMKAEEEPASNVSSSGSITPSETTQPKAEKKQPHQDVPVTHLSEAPDLVQEGANRGRNAYKAIFGPKQPSQTQPQQNISPSQTVQPQVIQPQAQQGQPQQNIQPQTQPQEQPQQDIPPSQTQPQQDIQPQAGARNYQEPDSILLPNQDKQGNQGNQGFQFISGPQNYSIVPASYSGAGASQTTDVSQGAMPENAPIQASQPQTQSQEIQPQQQEAQQQDSRPPGYVQGISFEKPHKSDKDFINYVRQFDAYKDWSDDEIKQIRKNKLNLNGLYRSIDQSRFLLFDAETDSELLPYIKIRENALRAALMDDFFYRGIRPDEASALTDVILDSMGPNLLKTMITSGQLSDSGQVKELFSQMTDYQGDNSNFLEQLPEEVAASILEKIKDTVVVSGTSGLFSALDQLGFNAMVNAVASGIEAVNPALGKTIKWGVLLTQFAHSAYKSYKEGNVSKYWAAFTRKPTSHVESVQYADLREQFVSENSEHFNYDEAQRIREGTYKDVNKIFRLLNKTGLVEDLMDFLFIPATTADNKLLGLQKSIYTEFPNYNKYAPVIASIYGGLKAHTKFSNQSPILKSSQMEITLPNGEKVPVMGWDKKFLNDVRKQFQKANQPPGYQPGFSQKAYNKQWENWANSKSHVMFEPYVGNFSLLSNQNARHIGASLIGGGADAILDSMFADAPLLRSLTSSGVTTGALWLDEHFYQMLNRRLQAEYNKRHMHLAGLSKSYGGKWEMTGNNVVFSMPEIGAEVTLTPEGLVTSRAIKKTTQPKDIKMTAQEIKKVPEYSPFSFDAVSKQLGIDLPDYVRASPADTIELDIDRLDLKIRDSWQKKFGYIENARNKELAPYLNKDTITSYYGREMPEGFVPGTIDLKKISQNVYDDAISLANRVSPKKTIKDFVELEPGLLKLFQENPEFVDSYKEVQKLFTSLKHAMNADEFSTGDLIYQYRKANKHIRDGTQAQAKDYQPERQAQIEAYKAYKAVLLELLPGDARNKLLEGDAAYAAYKQSESLDGYKQILTDHGNVKSWLNNPKSIFQKYADDIYNEFGPGHIAEALRMVMYHEDCYRESISQPNVSLMRNGKVVREGFSLEEYGDLSGVVNNIDRVSPFAPVSKAARVGASIVKKGDALAGIVGQERALESTPFQISPTYEKLVGGIEQQLLFREKKPPFSLQDKQNERPEVIKKAYGYNEQIKEDKKSGLQETPEDLANYQKIAQQASEISASQRQLIHKITNMPPGKERNQAIAAFEKGYKQYLKLRPKMNEMWLQDFDHEANIMQMFITGAMEWKEQ